MSQSELTKKNIVIFFNVNIKEFFVNLLKKVFIAEEKIDKYAKSLLQKGISLLTINKRTPYFLERWLQYFKPEYRDPIINQDVKFFSNYKTPPQKDNPELFDLLQKKGVGMSFIYQTMIFSYLNILLKISDTYIRQLTMRKY